MGWRTPKAQAVKPSYTGLQVQTSSMNLPVPVGFGKGPVAPNLIWYDNFQSHAQSQKVGKGGGSSTTTSYTYSADLMLALCEGPIAGIGNIWVNQSVDTLSGEGWTLFTGAAGQLPWGYLTTNYPGKDLNYPGLAYVAEANFPLDTSASIGGHVFEVQGPLSGSLSAIGNSQDADVGLAIQSYLTDPAAGIYFPSANLDTTTLLGGNNTTSLQCYCLAMGFGLSPVLSSQEQSSTTLARWLQLVNCEAVWSDGLLKFVSYAEQNVTGNGFTFVAAAAPIYDLGPADFVDTGDDPVKVSRIDIRTQPNILRLNIKDRANRYSDTPVESRDESAVNLYGAWPGNDVQANEVCSIAMAGVMGLLILRRGLYIRGQYKFQLSWEFCLLEPMDVVTLTEPNVGLSAYPVRIIEIQEQTEGTLEITAEDLITGLSLPTTYPRQGTTNNPLNQNVAPGNANTPFVIEPPGQFTGSQAEIWLGVSSSSLTWGGAEIWISTDNTTYNQAATVSAKAKQGLTTATLANFSGTNPDVADTLAVDLSESLGQVLSTTAVNAASGFNLCAVDGEIATFTTATLTSASHYNLTGLYRGFSNSPIASHASGVPFCVLDEAIAKIALPAGFVGRTVYIKVASFNIFGNALQDLAGLTAVTYTPTGVGATGFSNGLLSRLALGQATDLGIVGSAGAAPFASADLGIVTETVAPSPRIDLGSTVP